MKVSKEGTSTRGGEVSIFQTLKVDPFYGYYGQELTITEVQEIDDELILIKVDREISNIEEYIGNEMMFLENKTQEFPEGSCKESTNNHSFGFLKEAGRSTKFIILNIKDKDSLITKKAFFGDRLQFVRPSNKISIYKSNELEYSHERIRNTGLSFDRLMYIDNGRTSLAPLNPSNYDISSDSNYVLVNYDGIRLPLADEVAPSNIVAGYKVFINRKANIYAEAEDPATGRIIRSNTLSIDVALPDFLTSESGFQISGEGKEGNGIGGSSFLRLEQTERLDEELQDSEDIILYNPFKNGINIIIDNTEETP